MTTLSSRDFNQDVGRAKRAARLEPVFITDRGRPTHVLLSFETFRQLSGKTETIIDLLAMTETTPSGSGHRCRLGPGGLKARLMYLLDTPIILELRKARSGQTDAGLIRWASGVARQNLFMSALGLLELDTYVTQLAARDKAAGAALRTWLDDQVSKAFDGHILSVDAAVVKKRAHIPISDQRDGLMAATASVHGLVLVTRNGSAFKAARVKTFNPWGFTPEVPEDSADWRQVARPGPLWFKNLFLRF